MPRQKLTQRKDGRYACKYDNKFFYGKSATEALRKRDEFIKEKEAGFNHELADTRFLEYGLKWRQVYRCECNRNAQRQYDYYIKTASDLLHNPFIRDVTPMDIQRLFNSISNRSKSYIGKFSSITKGIFKSAAADGIIVRNPAENTHAPSGNSTGHRVLELWERELVTSTWKEHRFGLCAMFLLYTGLRIGEALYIDIDRDVDFVNKTVTVRGSITYSDGNKPKISAGKTAAAQRTIPLVDNLAKILYNHHGLLFGSKNGRYLTFAEYRNLFASYISYLERHLNGCRKNWYGRSVLHKALLAQGKKIPPWKPVTITCHDFRVTYCTLCYEAGIPIKTLQSWMGHADASMIMKIYAKLTTEKEQADRAKINDYFNSI